MLLDAIEEASFHHRFDELFRCGTAEVEVGGEVFGAEAAGGPLWARNPAPTTKGDGDSQWCPEGSSPAASSAAESSGCLARFEWDSIHAIVSDSISPKMETARLGLSASITISRRSDARCVL